MTTAITVKATRVARHQVRARWLALAAPATSPDCDLRVTRIEYATATRPIGKNSNVQASESQKYVGGLVVEYGAYGESGYSA